MRTLNTDFRDKSFLHSRRLPGLVFFAGAVLVVAIFYWARAILIPLALAILLTFLLSPLVTRLERWGVSRGFSVAIAVLFTLLLLSAMLWFAGLQVRNLADELPRYRANIRQKIGDMRNFRKGGALEKLDRLAGEVRQELNKDAARPVAPQSPPPAAPTEPAFSWDDVEQPLASAGLVLLLLIYMLGQREELRNRLIRLAGYGNLSVTTQALEELGRRISSYLLTQLAINSSFGLLIAIALGLIHLPYAFLWGFLATLLIFVPVIGFWLAATPPVLLSLAVFSSWYWPWAILALFLFFKTVNGIFLEPVFYGKSAGVLQVPLLILLAFWTWLWGPAGLMLATPLTVCLLVVAKHVPQLEFLSLLMSDEPALEPKIHFYQRLIARDYDEAADILENFMREQGSEKVYDDLLLPALCYTKADRKRGLLSDHQERFVFDTVEALRRMVSIELTANAQRIGAAKIPLLCCPADGEADELALILLRDVLDAGRFDCEIVSAEALASETVERVNQSGAAAVVIAALPPGGLAQTRYLCKRLRSACSGLHIVVMRWSLGEDQRHEQKALVSAGADSVVCSLVETRDQVASLALLDRPAVTKAG